MDSNEALQCEALSDDALLPLLKRASCRTTHYNQALPCTIASHGFTEFHDMAFAVDTRDLNLPGHWHA